VTRLQRVQYIVLTVLFVGSIAWFCYTWFSSDNLARNFGDRPVVFDVVFFAALTLVLLHPVLMLLLGWIVTGFGKLPEQAQPRLRTGEPQRVAIITTYVASSEPLSILARTLKSMKLAKDPDGWTHDVWVLDERTNQEDGHRVENLCRQLGVHYFTRKGIDKYHVIGSKFTPKSKGGNHNAWYDSHGFEKYDIVAQFDTDFVIRPDALLEILPHFSDPKVGWVGTPQIYTNPDHFIARGAAEQTYGFYGPFMRGLDGMSATMLIGANHTIRVSALREIGGYDPHLTEDLATGMALHSRGWQSRYVAKELAHGEGPTTWIAYLKQQFRWAKGCLDLLITSSVPRVRTMPKRQAFFYLWLQLFYLNGLMFGIALVLMLLKFGFGWESSLLNFGSFIVAYVPLLAMMEMTMLWVQRFNVRPKVERGLFLRARVLMLAAMPVFLWAFISAVRDRGKHTEFEVTAKGGMTVKVTVTRGKRKASVFAPHVIIVIATSIGFVVGAVLGNLDAVNVAWAIFVIASLLILVLRPQWFELKDEFNIQSRRFLRAVKQEARLLLHHEKKVGSIKLQVQRGVKKASLALPIATVGALAPLNVFEPARELFMMKLDTSQYKSIDITE